MTNTVIVDQRYVFRNGRQVMQIRKGTLVTKNLGAKGSISTTRTSFELHDWEDVPLTIENAPTACKESVK